jgi:hypothetical protein
MTTSLVVLLLVVADVVACVGAAMFVLGTSDPYG